MCHRQHRGQEERTESPRPEPPSAPWPQSCHTVGLHASILTLVTPLPFPVKLVIKPKEQNNHCWRPNYGEQPGGAVYRLCFGGNVLIYAVSNI